MNNKNIFRTKKIGLVMIISIVSIVLFSGFLANNKVSKSIQKPIATISKSTPTIILMKDMAIHNVHSGTPEKPTQKFESGNLSNGQRYSYTFTKKGIYKYFCTIHSSIMQATIVVK